MCLRSGWLEFLKSSIDRVLKNHPLDGVYYDWNVALFCCNPLHEANADRAAPAQGHWDIDELLELMEWTRSRVGPGGLVIVHNTTTPMFATENFADYVVATEWGYRKWTDRAPDLQDLPLEWSLVGAVPRGVISYGTIDKNAPRRLHRLFALEAFLGGVTPWPASEETFALVPLLKPLGDIGSYRFADWRNQAVTLSDARCASAVYSRPGEAYLLLANLDQSPREVTCVLHPEKLPHPLAQPATAIRLPATAAPSGSQDQPDASRLDVRQLIGEGRQDHHSRRRRHPDPGPLVWLSELQTLGVPAQPLDDGGGVVPAGGVGLMDHDLAVLRRHRHGLGHVQVPLHVQQVRAVAMRSAASRAGPSGGGSARTMRRTTRLPRPSVGCAKTAVRCR